MISVDANVLVYAADLDAAERNAIAKNIMKVAAATERVALTEQSFFEFLNVSIKKHKQPLATAVRFVADWTAAFPIIRPHSGILDETVILLERYKLSVWDARMIATCAMHACEFLLSEDMQDGALYGMVRVVNPFEPANGALVRELISA